MKVLKVILVSLLVLIFAGLSAFLFIKNRGLSKSFTEVTQKNLQLQNELSAIGEMTNIYVLKSEAKSGQEIRKEDLIQAYVPVSAIPQKIITNPDDYVGKYYRIALNPGIPFTEDLVMEDELKGTTYERDVFLDTVPVGTKTGDYIDIRVVLPDGEEFVAFSRRRVNAIYDKAIKMKFNEADLWLLTSMMIDRTIYKEYGWKMYATKYTDPGVHTSTVAYYPIRKEVVDVASISGNLTKDDLDSIWNEDIRKAVFAKLTPWTYEENTLAPKVAAGNQEEQGRYDLANEYYKSLIEGNSAGGRSKAKELEEEEKRAKEEGNSTGLINPAQDNISKGVEGIENVTDRVGDMLEDSNNIIVNPNEGSNDSNVDNDELE